MKSGLKMQELVQRIEELIEKIQSGQISREELDVFVDLTSNLHHKAVILRYKSFENQVFGKNQPLHTEETSTEEKPQEIAVEQPAAEVEIPAEEINESIADTALQMSPEELEEAEEELSHSHEEDEPTFDLFSLDLNAEPEISEEPEEPIADEGQSSAMEMEVEQTELETVPEIPVVEEVRREEVAVPSEPTQLHAIYQRIDRPDDSFASRFPINKIDNLSVAFGFNERLQTINDLFGGSSEVFSSAVQEIEQAASKDDARKIVTRYAHLQHWNASDDLAINFAKKVDQLYV